ncbi:DUF411 domain-containing protein [Billgrantia endophytica]|uniref:Metal-binding protein n=1 Tax=Billgrantia endophytica TaxID=2033802 RepID=A0A2N7U535_9GAMM|nr:DUF411 domain-containing protein [Halomonas endophytica]PMR75548.1 hypothetical protein C1H69_10030 [Halomonas endophytica]
MNRPVISLLLSGTLLMGAASMAHAALPETATLYMNPECGCCHEYARQLEERDVTVTLIDDVEIGKIKQQVGLPYGKGSCHTILMGDYAIEGHVPFEAVETLFEQRPTIGGIGLAGMPIGTPGMPGPKQDDWEVYQFTDRQPMPFMTR